VRRFVPLLLLLAVSATDVAAQYTYIVPVAGATSGFRSQYLALVTAFNPNATPATVRYEAIYPAPGGGPCPLPSAKTIAPRALVELADFCILELHAFVLTSDQPLNIMVDVDAFFESPVRRQLEPVAVATEWIPPESEAMIPTVRMLYPADKTNIVFVNPNDFLLTVDLHVERPELKKSYDETRQVPPRSFVMFPIAQIPTPPSGTIPHVYGAIHQITVRANGKFYAGASNEFAGSLVFREAIPLQP
jgi:hypothetical protein